MRVLVAGIAIAQCLKNVRRPNIATTNGWAHAWSLVDCGSLGDGIRVRLPDDEVRAVSAVGSPKQDGNLGSRWRHLAIVSTISGPLPVPGIAVMSAQASRGKLGVFNPHSKGVCLAVESRRGDPGVR